MSLGNSSARGFGRRVVVAERRSEQPAPSGQGHVSTSLILAFIGDNIEAFKPTVDAMAKKSDTFSVPVIGWCWPAFFFWFYWFCYRKLYALAAVMWLLWTVVPYFTIIAMILCGLFGKSIYVMMAARAVRKIIGEVRTPTEAVIAVRARGGVSWRAMLGGFAACVAAGIVMVLLSIGFAASKP